MLKRTEGVTGSNVEWQSGPLAAAESLKHSETLKQSALGQQLTAADRKITNRDYRLIAHNVQHALDNNNIMMGDIELFMYHALYLCQHLHNYNECALLLLKSKRIAMQSRRNRHADYVTRLT